MAAPLKTFITIAPESLDKLIRKADAIRNNFSEYMRRATLESANYVHSQVPDYPAPPPGSTYRRTGTLGRSITTRVEKLGRNWAGYIGTNVVYAPWVISSSKVGSRGPQARVHIGRWFTLQQLVKSSGEAIYRIYRRYIKDLIDL